MGHALILLFIGFCFGIAMSFNIPLPFGNIDFTKTPDGATQFGINSGLDINGNGAQSGMTITSKNGSVQTQTGGGVLVGGKKFGSNSTFGVNQQGLTADTDVNVGNNTLHGGLGKENTFLGDLTNTIQNAKKKQTGQGRRRN